MAENNIDIFKTEPLQTVLHSFDHVLTGETIGVGDPVFVGIVYFGADDQMVPGDVESSQGLPKLNFCLSPACIEIEIP